MNSGGVSSRESPLVPPSYSLWTCVVPRLPEVNPEVWRSRSWIVISDSAGTV